MTAAWIPCDCCAEFVCTIHELHAFECPCPAIEEWGDVDPYSAGGPDPEPTPQVAGKTEKGKRLFSVAALYVLFAKRGMPTQRSTLAWAKSIVRSNRE